MTTTTETRAAGIERVRKGLERDFLEVRVLESRPDPKAPFRAVFCLSPRIASHYMLATFRDTSDAHGSVEVVMRDPGVSDLRILKCRESTMRSELVNKIKATLGDSKVMECLRRDLRPDSMALAGVPVPAAGKLTISHPGYAVPPPSLPTALIDQVKIGLRTVFTHVHDLGEHGQLGTFAFMVSPRGASNSLVARIKAHPASSVYALELDVFQWTSKEEARVSTPATWPVIVEVSQTTAQSRLFGWGDRLDRKMADGVKAGQYDDSPGLVRLLARSVKRHGRCETRDALEARFDTTGGLHQQPPAPAARNPLAGAFFDDDPRQAARRLKRDPPPTKSSSGVRVFEITCTGQLVSKVTEEGKVRLSVEADLSTSVLAQPAASGQPEQPSTECLAFDVLEVARRGNRTTLTVDGKVVHSGPAGSADHIVVNTDLRRLEIEQRVNAGIDFALAQPGVVTTLRIKDKAVGRIKEMKPGELRDEIMRHLDKAAATGVMVLPANIHVVTYEIPQDNRGVMAFVESPATGPALAPDADADVVPGPTIPSTMGELRKAGGRPLITTDEGPRSGWGTYDDD